MFNHLTFEGVEEKANKECNRKEKAIMKERKGEVDLQKYNNKVQHLSLIHI